MLCWRTLHADLFSRRTLRGCPIVDAAERRSFPIQTPKRSKKIDRQTNLGAEAEGSLRATNFPSGYCSALRGIAGLLLTMVSTVPVMIPLTVRRSASTATTGTGTVEQSS